MENSQENLPVSVFAAQQVVTLGREDQESFRRTQGEFGYKDSVDFTEPVVLQSGKVFESNPRLTVPNGSVSLQELSSLCRTYDSQLAIQRIASVASMKVVCVTSSLLLLQCERDVESGDSLLLYVEAIPTQVSFAFKRLCSLLKIPYNFSKKNPTKLNQINLEHYLQGALYDSKLPSVDVIYCKEAVEISVARDAVTGEERKVYAHQLLNLLPVKGRRDTGDSLVTPEIGTRLPLLSKIMESLQADISTVPMSCGGMGTEGDLQTFVLNPVVQSYSLGYDLLGSGIHFVRVLFDNPELTFTVGGEEYHVGVNISADFLGNARKLGTVKYQFVMFRVVCANGATVAWNDHKHFAGVRSQVLQDILVIQGFNKTHEEYLALGDCDETEKYMSARSAVEARLSLCFGEQGMQLCVLEANEALNTGNLTQGFTYLTTLVEILKSKLEVLYASDAYDVPAPDFVALVELYAKDFQMPSAVMKIFLSEYLAGNVSGDQKFKRPIDVLNFLTFLARAYDTQTMLKIEQTACAFVLSLGASIADNVSASQVQYARAVKTVEGVSMAA